MLNHYDKRSTIIEDGEKKVNSQYFFSAIIVNIQQKNHQRPGNSIAFAGIMYYI
jgi:hypothetical protein